MCLACLLLVGCTFQPPAPKEIEAENAPVYETVTLWCAGEEDYLSSLVESFNALGGSQVTLWSFASEEELLIALTEQRPDLLWGSEELLTRLGDAGQCTDLSPRLASPLVAPCCSGLEGAGSCLFPYWAEVPLLIGEAGDGSMEDFCARASAASREKGEPFFSAESYAELFFSCLAQKGVPFSADKRIDGQMREFVSLYNLLAECAWDGALSCGEADLIKAVDSGALVCAFVPSSALWGKEVAFAVSPLPVMDGGSARCYARVWGFGVMTSTESGEKAAAEFLTWVCADGRSTSQALWRGLLPCAAEAGIPANSALSEAMGQVYEKYTLVISPYGDVFRANLDGFDAEFRRAMEILH